MYMSALRHEYSHYLEAKVKGFPSASESYKDWKGRQMQRVSRSMVMR